MEPKPLVAPVVVIFWGASVDPKKVVPWTVTAAFELKEILLVIRIFLLKSVLTGLKSVWVDITLKNNWVEL